MKLVKFKGPMGLPAQSARHLDQATLERLGVNVPESLLTHGNLVFGPQTDHKVEMSNEASDSLVAALPNEFEIVDELDSPDQMTMTFIDRGASLEPAENAVDDGINDDEESSDDE